MPPAYGLDLLRGQMFAVGVIGAFGAWRLALGAFDFGLGQAGRAAATTDAERRRPVAQAALRCRARCNSAAAANTLQRPLTLCSAQWHGVATRDALLRRTACLQRAVALFCASRHLCSPFRRLLDEKQGVFERTPCFSSNKSDFMGQHVAFGEHNPFPGNTSLRIRETFPKGRQILPILTSQECAKARICKRVSNILCDAPHPKNLQDIHRSQHHKYR